MFKTYGLKSNLKTAGAVRLPKPVGEGECEVIQPFCDQQIKVKLMIDLIGSEGVFGGGDESQQVGLVVRSGGLGGGCGGNGRRGGGGGALRQLRLHAPRDVRARVLAQMILAVETCRYTYMPLIYYVLPGSILVV